MRPPHMPQFRIIIARTRARARIRLMNQRVPCVAEVATPAAEYAEIRNLASYGSAAVKKGDAEFLRAKKEKPEFDYLYIYKIMEISLHWRATEEG